MRNLLALLLLTLLAGCASNVPEAIRTAPAEAPGVAAVRDDPEAYRGQTVRWGGLIAGVNNRAEYTEFQVVARRLGSGGRPVTADDRSPGRFLVRVPGFLDPAIHAEGRLLTVSGLIVGAEARELGEYLYRYPVVEAVDYHLWPELEPRAPAYYDPWYDPWWGPYPYPSRHYRPLWYGPCW
ncbi:Slp family lipoprotein [Alkalilimnicola ehrlichii]|uniref:Slp family lipoprotein n=1 Tax=Alkalilimnicola ehrlichii TaxID=351052 RepID=UPI003B9EC9CA